MGIMDVCSETDDGRHTFEFGYYGCKINKMVLKCTSCKQVRE